MQNLPGSHTFYLHRGALSDVLSGCPQTAMITDYFPLLHCCSSMSGYQRRVRQ